jgi:hypothetical protein
MKPSKTGIFSRIKAKPKMAPIRTEHIEAMEMEIGQLRQVWNSHTDKIRAMQTQADAQTEKLERLQRQVERMSRYVTSTMPRGSAVRTLGVLGLPREGEKILLRARIIAHARNEPRSHRTLVHLDVAGSRLTLTREQLTRILVSVDDADEGF